MKKWMRHIRDPNFGFDLAEKFTGVLGSWKFVNGQSVFLILYLFVNVGTFIRFGIPAFDAYPFTFLNLMLSFQAGYTGPIVLMASIAQARRDKERQERDRKMLEAIYHVLQRLEKYEKDNEKRDEALTHLVSGQQEVLKSHELLLSHIMAEVSKIEEE